MNKEFLKVLSELINHQKKVLTKVGEIYHPQITEEDLLQPNDFPTLDQNPLFRYEEGVLHGMQSALSALQNESKSHS